MTVSTLTSREFNQDVSKAKRAALNGPVFITDRGHVAHVLLAIDDYKKITKKKQSIVNLISMPADAPDIDFEPDPLKGKLHKSADLS